MFPKLSVKFSNKQTENICEYLHNGLWFDYENKVRLCPYNDIGILQENFDGLWLNVDKIIDLKEKTINSFKENMPEQCKSCPNLQQKSNAEQKELKYLYLANWKQCYINCKYCKYPKVEDLFKAGHYDIFPAIKQLIDSKLVTTKTKVIFECGDPCIHPEFDKILFYFINYEMENIVVNTPAQRFCESVAQGIGKNMTEVVISMDSGCPYIYKEVKGTNKFDIVTNNIKRYLEYQEPNQKRVILKYTIINGINDNQKEILDWFILSRDLGIMKLKLDVERNWYNQIKYSIPQYLKDLIKFTKDMSDYNKLEIEFGENAKAIYNEISKEEK